MTEQLIVAVFPSRVILTKALDRITELDYLQIRHATIVAKANSGEVVVLDDDISANEGAIAGGTLGAAITALGLVQMGALALPGVGPIIALGTGLIAGSLVGGMTGRFAANIMDFDYKEYPFKALAQQLEAGHPALVLETDEDPTVLTRLRNDLAPYRAEMVELLDNAPYLVNKPPKE